MEGGRIILGHYMNYVVEIMFMFTSIIPCSLKRKCNKKHDDDHRKKNTKRKQTVSYSKLARRLIPGKHYITAFYSSRLKRHF